jgi:hypothetical protein
MAIDGRTVSAFLRDTNAKLGKVAEIKRCAKEKEGVLCFEIDLPKNPYINKGSGLHIKSEMVELLNRQAYTYLSDLPEFSDDKNLFFVNNS